jgi:hypothetical protein
MQMQYNKLLIFNYLLLLLLSFFAAVIYLFYRDSSIIFNQIISTTGFEIVSVKTQIQALFPLPNWIIYSLPGGIWVYVTTILAVKYEKTKHKYTISNYPILFSVGLELFQLFHFTDGTFDWVDLILILIAGYFAKRSNLGEFPLKKYPRIQNLMLISAFLVLLLADVNN